MVDDREGARKGSDVVERIPFLDWRGSLSSNFMELCLFGEDSSVRSGLNVSENVSDFAFGKTRGEGFFSVAF